MTVAGIDTGKDKLDVAVDGCRERWVFTNDPSGWDDLVGLLQQFQVGAIGIEATGGYERGVAAHLRRQGLRIAVLQPRQVRAFAEVTLCRAKNDRIDAGLIAACMARYEGRCEPPDPRMEPLADCLTFIEQTEEDIARSKVRLEHVHDAGLRRILLEDIARLNKRRAAMIGDLAAAVRSHPDLGRRLDLVVSIDAIGERIGLALVLHMPELGHLSRQHIASLAGLAPFDRDTAKHQGERHIGGGRDRPRKASMPPPCRPPSGGIPSLSPSTADSPSPVSPTWSPSSPAPENCSSSPTPSSPTKHRGRKPSPKTNGCLVLDIATAASTRELVKRPCCPR